MGGTVFFLSFFLSFYCYLISVWLVTKTQDVCCASARPIGVVTLTDITTRMNQEEVELITINVMCV